MRLRWSSCAALRTSAGRRRRSARLCEQPHTRFDAHFVDRSIGFGRVLSRPAESPRSAAVAHIVMAVNRGKPSYHSV